MDVGKTKGSIIFTVDLPDQLQSVFDKFFINQKPKTAYSLEEFLSVLRSLDTLEQAKELIGAFEIIAQPRNPQPGRWTMFNEMKFNISMIQVKKYGV